MDQSGVTRLHQQPYLELEGQEVIVGVIDTGIDYTHPVFRNSDGSTRIIRIWDQSIEASANTMDVPQVDYGTVYTAEDINRALESANPEAIVPSMDTDGMVPLSQGLPPEVRIRPMILLARAPRSVLLLLS